MSLTFWIILLGILILCGFGTVARGFQRILSALYLIVDGLAEIYKLLKPIAEEARKRERAPSRISFADRMASIEADNAEERGLTVDEYRDLVSKAATAGMTVEEYEAKEGKR